MVAWALLALCVAAESSEPAAGSVKGPWAFVDLEGGLSLQPQFVARGRPIDFFGSHSALVGWGFDLEGKRFSPTLKARVGVTDWSVSRPQPVVTPLDFSFALMGRDLIHERVSGLRFSPVFIATVAATEAASNGNAPRTQLAFGLPMERRFGPVEISYRPEGRRYFSERSCLSGACVNPIWEIAQRLFAEAWVVPSFSVAAGVDLKTTWVTNERPPLDLTTPFPPRNELGAQLLATWGFSRLFGLTLRGTYTHHFSWMGDGNSLNVVGAFLSVWLRSDGKLERNWLER